MLRGLACMVPLVLIQCVDARPAALPAADSGTRERPNANAAQSPRLDAGRPDANGTSAAQPEVDAGSPPAHAGASGKLAPAAAGAKAGDPKPDAGFDPAADGGSEPPAEEDTSCLNRDTHADAAGPFSFEMDAVETQRYWVPRLPAGCKAPVVHFANGTGASCANYRPLLERLASHGFLVVCAENPNTGSGVPGLQALEAALSTYPELAAHKLGSAGHHAGGQGAILSLQQAEAKWGTRATYAGLALAPASGHGSQPPSGSWMDSYAALKSPLFVISGSADALVSENWVGDTFEALGDAVEAYWFSALDAPHLPIPLEHIQPAAVAWFRWKL